MPFGASRLQLPFFQFFRRRAERAKLIHRRAGRREGKRLKRFGQHLVKVFPKGNANGDVGVEVLSGMVWNKSRNVFDHGRVDGRIVVWSGERGDGSGFYGERGDSRNEVLLQLQQFGGRLRDNARENEKLRQQQEEDRRRNDEQLKTEMLQLTETLEHEVNETVGDISAQATKLTENATVAWQMAFYGLALTFKPGDRILTAEAEYGANYVAFLQIAKRSGVVIDVVPSDESGALDVAALEKMIDGRVKLIAVTRPATSGRSTTDSLESSVPTASMLVSASPTRTGCASTGTGPPGPPRPVPAEPACCAGTMT